MKLLENPTIGTRRVTAVSVVALLILLPAIWIAWSLYASSVVAETLRSQSIVLAGLQQRLSGLAAGPQSTGALADGASLYLPGETPAIAAAALQRLVASAIEASGGRVLQSEFAPVQDSGEDPGRVDLRVSFDAEIVGLQKLLFGLESGVPVLILRALTVQSPGAADAAAMENPPLRIDMLVSGHWEPKP